MANHVVELCDSTGTRFYRETDEDGNIVREFIGNADGTSTPYTPTEPVGSCYPPGRSDRINPRIARYAGTVSSAPWEVEPQSVTLTVLAGTVQVATAGEAAAPVELDWSDAEEVPAGMTLTWSVNSETEDREIGTLVGLDSGLQFTGLTADTDFLVTWTQRTYA